MEATDSIISHSSYTKHLFVTMDGKEYKREYAGYNHIISENRGVYFFSTEKDGEERDVVRGIILNTEKELDFIINSVWPFLSAQ